MDAEELRQRSHNLALAVTKFCEQLSRDDRTQEVAKQLHNAANSESMNYRAACRGRSHDEFVAKICITSEEADEVVGWLEKLMDSGRATGADVRRLHREATELMKIFAASKKTALANQKKRRQAKRKQREAQRKRR